MASIGEVFMVLIHWFVTLLVPRRFRPRKSVQNENVLITGAGSGLGRMLAVRFAELGARRLVLWDINQTGLQETCRLVKSVIDAGQSVHPYVCDVSEKDDVRKTAATVKNEVGAVTILINNCGILLGKLFVDLTEEEIERVMRVNTMSQFWTCKAFLPDMMSSNHGHLVSIASTAGIMGVRNLSDYCASKFALVGFDEALRMELKSGGYDGIKTTIVCPFFTSTGMYKGLGKSTMGIPVQTPEHVVSEIVDAVLLNEIFLVVPKWINVLMFLKAVLPISVFSKIGDFFDTDEMMKNFRGRKDIYSGKELENNNK